MPLYEYECDACGHRFEHIQKFSDPLEDKCPKCGGKVRKLFSSPAFQFKGSGFYITDYAKKDHGSRGEGRHGVELEGQRTRAHEAGDKRRAKRAGRRDERQQVRPTAPRHLERHQPD